MPGLREWLLLARAWSKYTFSVLQDRPETLIASQASAAEDMLAVSLLSLEAMLNSSWSVSI